MRGRVVKQSRASTCRCAKDGVHLGIVNTPVQGANNRGSRRRADFLGTKALLPLPLLEFPDMPATEICPITCNIRSK